MQQEFRIFCIFGNSVERRMAGDLHSMASSLLRKLEIFSLI